MKRGRWLVVACGAVTLGWLGLSGHLAGQVNPTPRAQVPANEVADLMALKLKHAERVLEAVTMADFDTLAKESQALSLLSQEAAFRVLMTAEYAQQSLEFRRAADALTRAAKAKNIDAAALAYVDMTMKCVNCHKHVRDVRMAKLPGLELPKR